MSKVYRVLLKSNSRVHLKSRVRNTVKIKNILDKNIMKTKTCTVVTTGNAFRNCLWQAWRIR